MTDLILEPVAKLAKDLRLAAATLTDTEARFLVGAYYSMQKDRIRDDHQERQLLKMNEPASVLSYLGEQHEMLEKQIGKALDVYSDSKPIGRWMRSIVGIGPVIAAGLMAHIDIKRVTTASHIWRFAGLDPSMKWHGAAAVDIVKKASQVEGTVWDTLIWLWRAFNVRPSAMLAMADAEFWPMPVLEAKAFAAAHGGDMSRATMVEDESDNVFLGAFDEPAAVFHAAYGDVDVDWAKLGKALARRPWNATLKTLCWKIGESFVKTSGHERSFYGPIYAQRKAFEIGRNERGEKTEAAAKALASKNYGKTTDAYNSYITGKLPPAHIHAGACRYTVKLFLSHLHEKWRTMEGLPVREPYIVAAGKLTGAPHAKIEPPN